MKLTSLNLLLLLASFTQAKVYFDEKFDDKSSLKSWKVPKTPLMNSKGEEIPLGKWSWEEGTLKTGENSRFYEISKELKEVFNNEGNDLVVQFSVRHPQHIDCGGGYLKVLGGDFEADKFNGESPYLLMFGPDICGTDRKVHVILTYKDKQYLIKKQIPASADTITHLYTLLIKPDQTYEVYVDLEKVAHGSITEDWDIVPPKKIKDPSAKKPSDWVDEKEIDDPEDKKPSNWDDEPEFINDEEAEKPNNWDEEMDGEWKIPQIKNPKYNGEWKPRKIKNPEYKGPWKAPLIENPEYFEDDKIYLMKEISAIGFDLWQVKSGSQFDNILLTDSIETAKSYGEEHWRPQYEADKKAQEEETKKLLQEQADREKEAKKEKEPKDNEGEEEESADEL